MLQVILIATSTIIVAWLWTGTGWWGRFIDRLDKGNPNDH